jgi:hypothetical protein
MDRSRYVSSLLARGMLWFASTGNIVCPLPNTDIFVCYLSPAEHKTTSISGGNERCAAH